MSTIDPIMGSVATKNISTFLFGRVRSAIIAILFCQNDQAFHLREIVRITGVGYGAAQRELANLAELGLATRRRQGNQILYQANIESPIFPELKSLMVKTVGIADIMKAALSPLADRIEFAFIYGSIAKGTDNINSDVDVMVIGDVTLKEIVCALRPAQDELHREINPSVFSVTEFQNRIASKDHFISSILKAPKIPLIGDEHDLG